MRARRLLVASLVLGTCLAGGRPAARDQTVVDLLEAYAAGRFDDVVAALEDTSDFGRILSGLRTDGPGWIAAAGPESRERRELVAATFALEAARAGQWREWKWIQRQPKMCAGTECYDPPNVLHWRPPPLLVEWGCELFRREATPRPVERWWQLAALAVAQRSEDAQFLIGDPFIGQGFHMPEIGNVNDEIKHLEHVTPRFPGEARFVLAQGIARDRYFPEDAEQVYRALENHPDVGAEALVRFGAMHMPRPRSTHITTATLQPGNANHALALRSFDRARTLTRDPYVLYLAGYFTAQTLQQQRRPREAERAYRAAASIVPHAQSATIALAALVFRDGRRSEAYELVDGMLAADPRPPDPWRAYVHADDRFWPYLVGRLRAEIRR